MQLQWPGPLPVFQPGCSVEVKWDFFPPCFLSWKYQHCMVWSRRVCAREFCTETSFMSFQHGQETLRTEIIISRKSSLNTSATVDGLINILFLLAWLCLPSSHWELCSWISGQQSKVLMWARAVSLCLGVGVHRHPCGTSVLPWQSEGLGVLIESGECQFPIIIHPFLNVYIYIKIIIFLIHWAQLESKSWFDSFPLGFQHRRSHPTTGFLWTSTLYKHRTSARH